MNKRPSSKIRGHASRQNAGALHRGTSIEYDKGCAAHLYKTAHLNGKYR